MNRTDREAMQLAIDQVLAAGGPRADQIKDKLATAGFTEAGYSASYCRQCDSMRLKPWDAPPCHTCEDDDDAAAYGQRPVEVRFLRKMLALGVSRFHPDPVAVIAEAEGRTKQ
jgi:hypothetical protein